MEGVAEPSDPGFEPGRVSRRQPARDRPPGLEVALVVCAVALVGRGRSGIRCPKTTFALTCGVAVLTTLALLSVLGVGSSFLTPSQ